MSAEATGGFEFPPPVVDSGVGQGPQEPSPSAGANRPYVFPSLRNPFVVGLAVGELFTEEELADPEVVTSSVVDRMAYAASQANDGYFRFNLDEIHGEGEPEQVTFGPGEHPVGLTEERSSRKLTLVLPLAIETLTGTLTVSVPQLGKQQVLTPGVMLMYPSFLWPDFGLAEGERFSAFVSYVYGPSFA